MTAEVVWRTTSQIRHIPIVNVEAQLTVGWSSELAKSATSGSYRFLRCKSILPGQEKIAMYLPVISPATTGEIDRQINPVEALPSTAAIDPRLRKVVLFMQNNLHRKFSLKEIAHSTGLSYSRMRHLFMSQLGITPVRLLNQLRMNEAKKRLETTLLSVKEIMVSVGVTDASNFTHSFKKAFGATPTEVRNNNQAQLMVTYIERQKRGDLSDVSSS